MLILVFRAGFAQCVRLRFRAEGLGKAGRGEATYTIFIHVCYVLLGTRAHHNARSVCVEIVVCHSPSDTHTHTQVHKHTHTHHSQVFDRSIIRGLYMYITTTTTRVTAKN